MSVDPRSVVDFWFSEETRPYWFEKSEAFDQRIRDSYRDLWESATRGECAAWAADATGAVALVIVLDQLPRNMFRGDARSFASDALALDVSKRALNDRVDLELEPEPRQFLYMPFMHSERLEDQERACELFAQPGMPGPEWAEKHKAIIQRFGRFPHRNDVLGRESTPEELAFLREPGSSF